MNFDTISSLVSRVFSFGALALVTVAALEGILNVAGFTMLRGLYNAGRLVEFAAILMIFVIALLLRQVRDGLKSS